MGSVAKSRKKYQDSQRIIRLGSLGRNCIENMGEGGIWGECMRVELRSLSIINHILPPIGFINFHLKLPYLINYYYLSLYLHIFEIIKIC